MATLTHASTDHSSEASWLTAYTNFIAKAEFTRFGWAVSALAIQGCVLSPALLLSMFYFGGGDWQFLVSMLCFLLVLVPVLSAMPVKYIFPAFATSLVLHLFMIAIDLL
ncbi:hypothetical protein GO730_15165 [Spirosoma sp. HMF3257]|uniref:Uncharacterized protein n=1 Tax=Spirosoma telluris TaxID=2183553 RepID=A0A327NIJ1_9BACT|nr:hypothetical protein [Spirosoma telluris]RAI75191.1 hypothetical protein HMF3257_15110 [Spirosoma telluris]